MKITTWNINSIRIRAESIKKYIALANPDIICFQETKVTDEKFPVDFFTQQNYQHLYFSGEKSYNGVAIVSKIPFSIKESLSLTSIDQKRHIAVMLPGDIELHNFYFPAGGDIADAKENPKFAHKLDYIRETTEWFQANREKQDKIILVGDLNIAPLENDVWSHKQLLNVVSHTPIEVDHLNNLYRSIDFKDAVRKFVPENQKLYSWWSYRNRDWKKSNRGRRLDHIWVTDPLINMVSSYDIHSETRDHSKPSDHVPINIKIIVN